MKYEISMLTIKVNVIHAKHFLKTIIYEISMLTIKVSVIHAKHS